MQVPTPDDNLGLNAEAVSDALRQLLRKGQIVLAGPPGTGKTLLARELAHCVCDQDSARWRLIQLHPSYSYEDFISGLRPRGGGAAGFLVQPGHLLRILLKALRQPGKRFCLVVDEFNRAKLATVLGELLTMIGGSRRTASRVRIRDAPAFQAREEWRSLASPICMPPNLYLICTMNTADRSIAAFDAALQRRFGMVQMVPCLLSPRAEVPNPEQPLLLPYSDANSVLMQRCRLPPRERQDLCAALDAINAKLGEQGFEPGERVGHSYFLSSDCSTQHHVRAAWREGVIPYLESVMQDRSQDLIRVIERDHSILAGGGAPPAPRANVLKQAERLAEALSVPCEVRGALEGWLSQLHGSKTHALLFAGPPGCGKTFTAEALAKVLVDGDSKRWETITFSPSYSYEEFMVGVRPDPRQPGKYQLQRGVLLEMADRCTADGQRRRCVLVIDEFNRAKLPQVMGECLNMLEYRGRKVDLRDNTQESLPDELYVIAMMNNADRSIEPLDSALRRRFATVTFDATKEPFRSIAAGALQSRFKDLSNVAGRMQNFLDAAHSVLRADEQIGVCFFCDAAEELEACARVAEKRTKLVSVLKQVWAAEVGPYVELHCGESGRLDKVKAAWDAMVDGISGDASDQEEDEDDDEGEEEDAVLFSCGRNGGGQLGLGNTSDKHTLQKVTGLPSDAVASQVACGGSHTWVLCEGGRLFSCGYTSSGQLGLGKTSDKHMLQEVTGLPSGAVASQVACGGDHTWVLCEGGRLFSCGYNGSGQLGLGSTNLVKDTLQEVAGLPSDAVPSQVACGDKFTWVLCDGGRLFSCGDNYYGQLGRTGDRNTLQAVDLSGLDGAVASQVACGRLQTWVLCTDGLLFSCSSSNDEGPLGHTGDGGTLQKVTGLPSGAVVSQVACGWDHTWVLCEGGRLFSCGYNGSGQLGLGNTNFVKHTLQEVTGLPSDAVASQVACGAQYTWVLCEGGRLFSCGNSSNGQLGLDRTCINRERLQEVTGLPSALQMACGGRHTWVLCEPQHGSRDASAGHPHAQPLVRHAPGGYIASDRPGGYIARDRLPRKRTPGSVPLADGNGGYKKPRGKSPNDELTNQPMTWDRSEGVWVWGEEEEAKYRRDGPADGGVGL